MTSLRGHERAEFPTAVKRAAFRRCCRDGTPYCEGCGIELKPGNIEYEHVVPDGLGGTNTLDNCKVYCRKSCARRKTDDEDNPRMAKADRVLRKTYGLAPRGRRIQSAGFRRPPPQETASRPLTRKSYPEASA